METKKCSHCRRNRTLDNFHNRKLSKDGLSYICKDCVRDCNNKFKELNPDYMNKWFNKNPDYKKNYYQNNSLIYLKKLLKETDILDDKKKKVLNYIINLLGDISSNGSFHKFEKDLKKLDILFSIGDNNYE